MRMTVSSRIIACLTLAIASAPAQKAAGQEITSAAGGTGQHPWVVPSLLAKAKKEGASLTIYGSINEGEALPLWKIFEQATGIKVNYVRGSDSQILARIALESRARKPTWDIIETTSVTRLPPSFLAKTDPPEAKKIDAKARSASKRWYGMYENYNAPAYNTQHVKGENLPKTYEGFLKHKEWAGHVAIDHTDDQWLYGLYAYYGDAKATKLVKDLVSTLKPALVDGHLALARDVGSGDYWVALNNFVNLTVNVKLSGAPTDYWGVNPTGLFFGEIGVSAKAAHPAAALLAENFVLSKEGQTQLTKAGRIPVRPDVTPNPPDEVSKLGKVKLIPSSFNTAQEKKWSAKFAELFHTH